MSRACIACQRYLDRDAFSRNQWSKGVGASRCSGCVHGGGGGRGGYGGGYGKVTERTNGSCEASFKRSALDHPFSQGAFRWVAKGVYVGGERDGQAAVTKWFKSGHTFEQEFFDLDIKAVDKAIELVREFNNQDIVGSTIKMNRPEVWTFFPHAGSDWAGRKTLTEPFIENWEKFNSNTGWNDDDVLWGRVMQALSHFSYHASGGQFVLCDLQGGIYRDGAVLTDPVILSRNKLYGPTDLGPNGISSFFSRHVCNEFCRSGWTKPRDQSAYHRAKQGTSMVDSGAYKVPSLSSRPYMSQFLDALDESDEEDDD